MFSCIIVNSHDLHYTLYWILLTTIIQPIHLTFTPDLYLLCAATWRTLWWTWTTATLWPETTCLPCCPRSGPSCSLSCSRTPTAPWARGRGASWWCCRASSATSSTPEGGAEDQPPPELLFLFFSLFFWLEHVLQDTETKTTWAHFWFVKGLVD